MKEKGNPMKPLIFEWIELGLLACLGKPVNFNGSLRNAARKEAQSAGRCFIRSKKQNGKHRIL